MNGNAHERARITLIRGAGPPAARDGGLERYGRWLEGALAARGLLGRDGVRLGLRALDGGEAVRTGDGVTAAWAAACARWPLRWRARIAAERQAVRAARRVVAISPMVAAELAAWYGRDDARVVLNPVFASSAAPEPRARGAAVLVGHGFRRKGVEAWLRALPHLAGLAMTHIIGADAHPGRWRRLARRLGVADRVTFHGPVEAAPWIAGASLLVHPARYEPYGNVVAEAVAADVPVVASDGCGAACLLDPTHVWARASGPEGLAAVVALALRSPRPPIRRPPSADQHLAALQEAILQ
jgi:glycosyltransferase involved in cell wall biosynthesis